MKVADEKAKRVTTREAQHHLTKVLKMVEAGEEVIITRRGKEVARLSPYQEEQPQERKVDWSEAIRRRDEVLAGLPKLKKNVILELREEERY